MECGQKRQNTAAVQNVAAIPDQVISLAFWSAAVLRRFPWQHESASLVTLLFAKTVTTTNTLWYDFATASFGV